jgi:DNA-binding XRE family transcriptional regulator
MPVELRGIEPLTSSMPWKIAGLLRDMTALPLQEYSYVPEFGLGDRLRRARESAGMSQVELAEAIGASQRSISNYEADATTPKALILSLWAFACQVSLPWLAWGDPNGPRPTKDNWPSRNGGATGPVTIGYVEETRSRCAAGSAQVIAA